MFHVEARKVKTVLPCYTFYFFIFIVLKQNSQVELGQDSLIVHGQMNG